MSFSTRWLKFLTLSVYALLSGGLQGADNMLVDLMIHYPEKRYGFALGAKCLIWVDDLRDSLKLLNQPVLLLRVDACYKRAPVIPGVNRPPFPVEHLSVCPL